jgi:type II secretion system protein H
MTPKIRGTRFGFTLIEMILAMLMLGIIAGIAIPRVREAARGANSARATRTIALDLEQAVSLAVRQRAPVDIVHGAGSLQFTIQNAEDGTVYVERDFSDGSSAHVSELALTPTTIRIFPTGRTSASLAVTVGSGDEERTITMSQAGQVRIVQ